MKNSLKVTNQNAELALSKSKSLLNITNGLLSQKASSILNEKFQFKPYFSDGHTDSVFSLAITPNGEYIVSGGGDKTIKLWDINSGKCIKTLDSHDNEINSVVVTPNGKTIISGSSDKTIKLWDINSGKCIKTLDGHSENVSKLEDGAYFYTIKDGSTITMFENGYFNASKENIDKFIRINDTPLSSRKLTKEEIEHFCKIKYDSFDINEDVYNKSQILNTNIDEDDIPF